MYLLFDIGGSKMRLAASFDGTSFDIPKVVPTPKDFREAIQTFTNIGLELARGEKIQAAAGGVRALDRNRQRLINHPINPMWVNEPLHDTLQSALHAPVYLENDAAIAGLGEATFGAGEGYRIVAYLTIGTGLGGARIVDCKIDASCMGFEPGSQIIEVGEPLRYLEELVSGYSLEKTHGKNPSEISDPQVWETVVKYLAIGLNNTIVHWSPDIVVLGGSIMRQVDTSALSLKLKEVLKIFPDNPKIVKAKLGDAGGLYGALKYINPSLKPITFEADGQNDYVS